MHKNETRFALTTPNGDAIRFQAHKDKPELVVAKFHHPETLENLIADLAVDPGVQDSWQGAHYRIVSLQREGAAKLIAAAFTKYAVPMPEPEHVPAHELESYEDDAADD